MKKMGIIVLGFVCAAVTAQATPVNLKNCKSDIVTEFFTSCPGGEGGSSTVCGSIRTLWGSVTSDMSVDSEKETASLSLVYTSVKGEVVRSKAVCSMGEDHWMECTSTKAVPSLGKLNITFNISGIATGVYFVDIFADQVNVPVGGFQNTEMACGK